MVLDKSPDLAGQLMNPSLRNFYEKTQDVWLRRAIVLQHAEDVTTCQCGKDECMVCYEQEQEGAILDSPLAPGKTLDLIITDEG